MIIMRLLAKKRTQIQTSALTWMWLPKWTAIMITAP